MKLGYIFYQYDNMSRHHNPCSDLGLLPG
uniref:Uncharacterized protein n=1 Tax=Arundo donax TaxID=35708 RepID=A0A0A9A388_ARUDO